MILYCKPGKKYCSNDGAVKIPAKYELGEDQNLSDVIEHANGISFEADLSNVFLMNFRWKNKIITNRNIKQFNNILVNDGDKIFIRKHSFRSEYSRSSLKAWNVPDGRGRNISELIEKAGGYTENAYPFRLYMKIKKLLY